MVAAWTLLTLPLVIASGINQSSGRQERAFNPVSLVNFPNYECVNDDGIYGECYSASECQARGGAFSSTCASGFGVCCYNKIKACGGTVTQNNTYLQNPGYSDTYSTSGTCTYKITKISKDDICMIRLDFESMILETPTSTGGASSGICSTDTLTITEGVSRLSVFRPPVQCGLGTGQHLYLSADEGLDVQTTIAIALGSTSTSGRKWNIRVRQIECDNRGRPPSTECSQYFTGNTGQMVSWNYDDSNYIWPVSQSYSICIRREKGYCGVSYTQADETNSFTWGGSAKGRAGSDSPCSHTHLSIPGGSPTGSPLKSYERLCGGAFGADDTDLQAGDSQWITYRRPFRIYVHSDDALSNANPRRGYKLDYRQLLCSTQ